VTKAATLDLASVLALNQLDAAHLAPFYDEAVYALGALPYLLALDLVGVSQVDGISSFPDAALTLQEVWYGDRALDPMTHDELSALAVQWQEHYDTPLAFSVDNLSLRRFRLYPIPVLPSAPLIMNHFGGAFGIDYPSGNAVTLATCFLQDLPSWLELPLIYMMLSREYMLESDHQDLDFAHGCAQVGTALLGMLPLAPII
jgi:hypothetical protein